jgi:hypothetical protein
VKAAHCWGLISAAMMASGACAAKPLATSGQPAVSTTPPTPPTRDSISAALVPLNLGSLRQDDIAIVLQPPGIRATAIPLDEDVIRVLAPDSYRALRGILESRRGQISQRGQMR